MKLSSSVQLTAAVLLVVGLAACSSPSAQSTSSLADTKLAAQLLRNEAAQRLMDGTDESVAYQEDFSAACKSVDEDPEGLYRSWRSTIVSSVPESGVIGVEQSIGALATSFAEDGWVFKEAHDDDSVLKSTTMTSSTSPVTLKISAKEQSNEGASVYIEANGPCVLTGGPKSDEVKALKG